MLTGRLGRLSDAAGRTIASYLANGANVSLTYEPAGHNTEHAGDSRTSRAANKLWDNRIACRYPG